MNHLLLLLPFSNMVLPSHPTHPYRITTCHLIHQPQRQHPSHRHLPKLRQRRRKAKQEKAHHQHPRTPPPYHIVIVIPTSLVTMDFQSLRTHSIQHILSSTAICIHPSQMSLELPQCLIHTTHSLHLLMGYSTKQCTDQTHRVCLI